MSEINQTPQFSEISEMTLRERVFIRLHSDHSDMGEAQFSRWLDLLHDDNPHGRTLAISAALTMMDVRDGPVKALHSREKFGLMRKEA